MGGKSASKAAANDAAQARADEEARQARIRQGTTSINTLFDDQFNDTYFRGRRDAFTNHATPQLDDQYGKAQKELTFALTRSGLLDSSVRGEKAGELQKTMDLGRQQVADQAIAQEGQARNAVEDARGNLIATLNATGDAQGAANSAIARAQALSQPAAFSPIGNLFADFTGALGTQAALEKANYYSGGQTGARYNTGLFTPSNSTVVKK